MEKLKAAALYFIERILFTPVFVLVIISLFEGLLHTKIMPLLNQPSSGKNKIPECLSTTKTHIVCFTFSAHYL